MFYDAEWYPMILVGRTGNERPREKVLAESRIIKKVREDSLITKKIRVPGSITKATDPGIPT